MAVPTEKSFEDLLHVFHCLTQPLSYRPSSSSEYTRCLFFLETPMITENINL